jgi:signal transduction histidine kinase
MDLEGAALLLVQEQHLVLQEATGTLRALGRQGAVLLADETLVRHLIQVGAPVAMEALPVVELSHPAIHLWVPLILAGELQGVLLLGAKRTDEFFSPQDRRLLGMLAGQAALAAQNVRLVAELQARMDELARDRHELQAAYRHLARSREDERRRVAAELHDDVIQPLAALNMEIARYAKAAGGEVGQGLRDLGRRVAGIVKVIRRVCAGLRPPVLDWGLVPTLRSHLRAFREETGLEVELVYDEVPKLSEEEEVLLFRLVQEALNNVRRHAQASTVHVCLAVTSAGLELSVTDDGIGFRTSGAGDGGPARSQADPAAPAGLEEHFGLRFMREYVEALGGQLRVDSRPGQGTTVTAWVPWVDDAPHTPDDEQQVGGSCAPGRPTLSDAARQRLSPSSIPRPPLPEDNTVPKKDPR